MTPAAYLGEFEQLVLLAILQLGDAASGAAIRQAIEDGGRRTVWIGAVYTTLERLEAKGLVRARVVDPGKGERRRKHYALEPAGRAAIAQAHATWQRMTRGLKPKLDPK
jgi:DNA-binding PadR family transcriptional regulator